ncbi:MAG: HAMP domain-containing histidine kinase [Candidatus Fournierella pullistercoris]|uniref:histidine kinase n=1 Tax=Candidatus Allofournierella pullistercoris TaxID=2838597 RepID=A0A948WRL9_9FIRM|nr:HAMP domain-containing histidine kinase [Candidatus Fournierella pullistercoris]
MLRRLRLRITLLAALLTGVVLAAVLSVACRIAGEQYTTGRLDAFDTAVNQLQYRWEQFNQLEDSWLQQLEAENGVLIQLEENGHPLLYSKRRSTADQTLLQAVRDTAEQHYTVNLSSRPLAEPNTQQPNFSLTAPDGQVYRCTLRLNLSANRWTTLLAAQNLTVEQTYLNHLGLLFALVGVGAWLLICLICWFVAGRAVRPVAEAMEQQQQFICAAGHELRTPLTVIRANAGAALQHPGKADKYLHIIDSEGKRMGTLVDELLLLSAGASARHRLQLETVAPDTFLLDFAESIEPLAVQAGRKIQVELPDKEVPLLQCDSYRLRQLLTILVDNALRFAPEHTTIRLQLVQASGRVQFRVIDQGPGVALPHRKRIFDRFYSEPSDGIRPHCGLGLAVARELALLHGGRIWVQDTPGGGATFCVELPSKKRGVASCTGTESGRWQ